MTNGRGLSHCSVVEFTTRNEVSCIRPRRRFRSCECTVCMLVGWWALCTVLPYYNLQSTMRLLIRTCAMQHSSYLGKQVSFRSLFEAISYVIQSNNLHNFYTSLLKYSLFFYCLVCFYVKETNCVYQNGYFTGNFSYTAMESWYIFHSFWLYYFHYLCKTHIIVLHDPWTMMAKFE